MINKVLIVALALGAGTGWAATDVRQTDITADTTWGLGGSPYYVYGDIAIKNGATLTVNAGVEVRFVEIHGDGGYEDGAELVVRSGALVAEGTHAMPVLFTTANQFKQPGVWGAIIVEYGNQYILTDAVIEYARNGLRLYNTTAGGASNSSVDGTEIRYCGSNGVFAFNSTANFYHLTVTQNTYAGIKTGGSANISVHASDIVDNGMYNFSNGAPNNVDASDCWWGTTSPALIDLKIYDHLDNPAVGLVDYTPFLNSSWRDGGNIPTYSLGLVKSVFR